MEVVTYVVTNTAYSAKQKHFTKHDVSMFAAAFRKL
jgi:hypothetical protein